MLNLCLINKIRFVFDFEVVIKLTQEGT